MSGRVFTDDAVVDYLTVCAGMAIATPTATLNQQYSG
jgi:hypothetical protein